MTLWGPDPSRLRVGDVERESATRALSEHFVAGRLSKEEYDERSTRAFSAKTRRELDLLFTDLPALMRPPTPPAPAPVARRRRRPTVATILLVLVVLIILTGWHSAFGLLLPLVLVLVILRA